MENDRIEGEPLHVSAFLVGLRDQQDAAITDLVRILVKLVAELQKHGFSRAEALHFARACMQTLLTN